MISDIPTRYHKMFFHTSFSWSLTHFGSCELLSKLSSPYVKKQDYDFHEIETVRFLAW